MRQWRPKCLGIERCFSKRATSEGQRAPPTATPATPKAPWPRVRRPRGMSLPPTRPVAWRSLWGAGGWGFSSSCNVGGQRALAATHASTRGQPQRPKDSPRADLQPGPGAAAESASEGSTCRCRCALAESAAPRGAVPRAQQCRSLPPARPVAWRSLLWGRAGGAFPRARQGRPTPVGSNRGGRAGQFLECNNGPQRPLAAREGQVGGNTSLAATMVVNVRWHE
jgi:hypothetical protein